MTISQLYKYPNRYSEFSRKPIRVDWNKMEKAYDICHAIIVKKIMKLLSDRGISEDTIFIDKITKQKWIFDFDSQSFDMYIKFRKIKKDGTVGYWDNGRKPFNPCKLESGTINEANLVDTLLTQYDVSEEKYERTKENTYYNLWNYISGEPRENYFNAIVRR